MESSTNNRSPNKAKTPSEEGGLSNTITKDVINYIIYIMHEQSTKKSIVLVDGFNLYFGIRSLNKPDLKWVNIERLSKNFLHDGQILEKVYYCTARVKENTQKQKRQNKYIEALETCKRVELLFGKFKVKQSKCPQCNFPIIKYEEKMSDVNIGVQLVKAASEGDKDEVYIVSGDTDLFSAIKVAREINPKMKIIVAFPPNRFNNEMKSIADASFIIGKNMLRKSLFKDSLKTKSGYLLKKPKSWSKPS